MTAFLFPRWTNLIGPLILKLAGGGALYAAVFVYMGFAPEATTVGHRPIQPVPYSHAFHVGELGLDCRFCHTTVEDAAFAAVPPTQTCMNCHNAVQIKQDGTPLQIDGLLASYETGKPVEWVRVHQLPDFVYFNHSAHVNAGVGCESCHGRIDQQIVVRQQESLSMGWCLNCHRAPDEHLRPFDQVTTMGWKDKRAAVMGEDFDQAAFAKQQRETYNINPSSDCYTCHR